MRELHLELVRALVLLELARRVAAVEVRRVAVVALLAAPRARRCRRRLMTTSGRSASQVAVLGGSHCSPVDRVDAAVAARRGLAGAARHRPRPPHAVQSASGVPAAALLADLAAHHDRRAGLDAVARVCASAHESGALRARELAGRLAAGARAVAGAEVALLAAPRSTPLPQTAAARDARAALQTQVHAARACRPARRRRRARRCACASQRRTAGRPARAAQSVAGFDARERAVDVAAVAVDRRCRRRTPRPARRRRCRTPRAVHAPPLQNALAPRRPCRRRAGVPGVHVCVASSQRAVACAASAGVAVARRVGRDAGEPAACRSRRRRRRCRRRTPRRRRRSASPHVTSPQTPVLQILPCRTRSPSASGRARHARVCDRVHVSAPLHGSVSSHLRVAVHPCP